jgi:hypothetical protein
MKFKDVNLRQKNQGLITVLQNKNQLFLIDANIFIPPDRSKENSIIKPVEFEFYKKYWIEPFIDTFKPIGIHDAVFREFESNNIKTLIENRKNDIPPSIYIYYDTDLNEQELIVRATIESKIAKYTNYNPTLDNRDDRGEVKSLSYIATKQLMYFCSHDSNAIRLVEDSERLETSLEEVFTIKPYEVLYYFVKNGIGDADKLRVIYKYLYYLTTNDKKTNPSWGEFTEKMDTLYNDEIDKG